MKSEIPITILSHNIILGLGLHSFKCIRVGNVKAIGAQARAPSKARNLSNCSAIRIDTMTVKITMRALLRFLNHCRFLLLGQPL